MNTKITLDPKEDSELGFNLSIEGKTSDVDSTKPDIRFIVKEQASNRAVMFDNIKHENGTATVTLPGGNSLFSEGKDYVGSLEVILGRHYFVATKVDLEFVEPLKVEASIVMKNSQGEQMLKETQEAEEEEPLKVQAAITTTKSSTLNERPEPEEEEETVLLEEDPSIDREIEALVKKQQKPAVVRPQAPVIKEQKAKRKKKAALSYSDLSEKEKLVVNKIFVAECKKLGVDNPKKELREGTNYTKKRLKALIGRATKQVINHQKRQRR
jgi:hypothetical protein